MEYVVLPGHSSETSSADAVKKMQDHVRQDDFAMIDENEKELYADPSSFETFEPTVVPTKTDTGKSLRII